MGIRPLKDGLVTSLCSNQTIISCSVIRTHCPLSPPILHTSLPTLSLFGHFICTPYVRFHITRHFLYYLVWKTNNGYTRVGLVCHISHMIKFCEAHDLLQVAHPSTYC